MNLGGRKSVSSQFLIDPYGNLVVRPTSLLPYLVGAGSFVVSMLAVLAYFSEPSAGPPVWLFVAIVLFFGGTIGFTVTRLAGFPRLRVNGHILVQEHYFTGPTTMDLSQLGQAFAFSMRRSTHIGFRNLKEEYAHHMMGRSDELDKFNAARVIDVTSMVGLSLRGAKRIAREINNHRSQVPRPNLEYEQIRAIATTTTRKRAWAVAIIAVISVAGAVLKRLLG